MIEKMARAMQGCNALMAARDMPWDDCDPRERKHWIDLATAALNALREPSVAMTMAGREPIMAFQDKGYGPKWNLGNHMDAGGYKGWATEEERKFVNITKGDCAAMVWRAMVNRALKQVHDQKPHKERTP